MTHEQGFSQMARTKQFKVTFQPQGRAVSVLEGTTLLEAAGQEP